MMIELIENQTLEMTLQGEVDIGISVRVACIGRQHVVVELGPVTCEGLSTTEWEVGNDS